MENTLNSLLEILKVQLFSRISSEEKYDELESELEDYAEFIAVQNQFKTDLSKIIIKIYLYQMLLGEIKEGRKSNRPQLEKNDLKYLKELTDVVQLQKDLGIKSVDEKIFIPQNIGSGKQQSNRPYSFIDIKKIKSYLLHAEKDKKLKDLAALIGRHGGSTEKKQTYAKSYKPAVAYDGITFSDNIGLIIPSELALHNNPKTLSFFLQKHADKQIQTYKLGNGNSYSSNGQKEKGPVIVCIDTSGSMQGKPETIAKTMLMALVKTVIKEKRQMLLINFSTAFETIEISPNSFSITKLEEFLEKSFWAGTDITGALKFAVENQKDNLKDADILLISDFCDTIASDQIKDIELAKENGTIFYGLYIKNKYLFGSKTILSLMDMVVTKDKNK